VVKSCEIVNSSVKFKFIPKVSIIHEKFLALLNLLRDPDVTCLRIRAAGFVSLSYAM